MREANIQLTNELSIYFIVVMDIGCLTVLRWAQKKRKAGVSFVSLFSILLQTESLISRKEKEERRGRSPIAQSRKRRVGLLGSRTTVIATRNESFRSKIVRIRNRPSVSPVSWTLRPNILKKKASTPSLLNNFQLEPSIANEPEQQIRGVWKLIMPNINQASNIASIELMKPRNYLKHSHF